MKAIQLEISGNWAQFRRAETNNNPLSHDVITKTAFLGLIGAVLGIDRTTMKELFPIWSRDFLYGVQIVNEVNKQSWGFTLRKAGSTWSKSPGQMEFIRNPKYIVTLALASENSVSYFEQFVENCKSGKACYEPVLGLHNCPAEILFLGESVVTLIEDGVFETKGFVTNEHSLADLSSFPGRLGFDTIPVFQNNDFWNNEFQAIIYPSADSTIKVQGKHYDYDGQSKWCLI